MLKLRSAAVWFIGGFAVWGLGPGCSADDSTTGTGGTAGKGTSAGGGGASTATSTTSTATTTTTTTTTTSGGGGAPGDPNNLANRSVPLAWDGANDADNRIDASGSLRGSTPFAFAGERIDIQAFSTGTNVRDWTGYVISAQVKLVSGGNFRADCPLQAHLYVSTAPSYDTRVAAFTSLVTGQWVTLTYDMADPGLV